MTIAEKIKSRVDHLEPTQQIALLGFLESLEISRVSKSRKPKPNRSRKSEISAAVRGIAGLWKDRTDLPKDSVEAVKVLRARMYSRGRNA